MKVNYEFMGHWWNSRDIELVKIDGIVYALDGWNGEAYTESWRCDGESYCDASPESFTIKPVYVEVEEDQYEIVDYEVRENH